MNNSCPCSCLLLYPSLVVDEGQVNGKVTPGSVSRRSMDDEIFLEIFGQNESRLGTASFSSSNISNLIFPVFCHLHFPNDQQFNEFQFQSATRPINVPALPTSSTYRPGKAHLRFTQTQSRGVLEMGETKNGHLAPLTAV